MKRPANATTLYCENTLTALNIRSYTGRLMHQIYFDTPKQAVLAMFHPSLQDWLANKMGRRAISDPIENTADYHIYLSTVKLTKTVVACPPVKSPELEQALQRTIDNRELEDCIRAACETEGVEALKVVVPIVLRLEKFGNLYKTSFAVNDFHCGLTGFILADPDLVCVQTTYRLNQPGLLKEIRRNVLVRLCDGRREFDHIDFMQLCSVPIACSIASSNLFTPINKWLLEPVDPRLSDNKIQTTLDYDGPNCFEMVPGDILRLIGLRLTLREVYSLNRCSKRLNAVLCANEVFWQEKVRHDFLEDSDTKPTKRSWKIHCRKLTPMAENMVAAYYTIPQDSPLRSPIYKYANKLLQVKRLVKPGTIDASKTDRTLASYGKISVRIPEELRDKWYPKLNYIYMVDGFPETAIGDISSRNVGRYVDPLANFFFNKSATFQFRNSKSNGPLTVEVHDYPFFRKYVLDVLSDNSATPFTMEGKTYHLIKIRLVEAPRNGSRNAKTRRRILYSLANIYG